VANHLHLLNESDLTRTAAKLSCDDNAFVKGAAEHALTRRRKGEIHEGRRIRGLDRTEEDMRMIEIRHGMKVANTVRDTAHRLYEGLVGASVTDDPYPNRLALVQKQLSDPTAFATGWEKGAYRNRDMALVDDQAMADWLDEHTLPNERVFLWTYDPMIYFLANRRLVSRFLYTYPLVVTWGPDTYDQELLEALKATPPAVFVVGSRDATPPVMGHKLDSVGTFDRSGPLKEWVLENYEEVTTVNNRFHVYEQKQPGVAP
jgi:hypothetical protein